MKLSKLIEYLQEMQTEQGNLDVFDAECYPVLGVKLEASPENWPKSWNMPDKWVAIETHR